MNLLLDTHILIWFLEGNGLLNESRRRLIVDLNNSAWVSVASLWEMAIKISVGKLTLAQPLNRVIEQCAAESIGILLIEPAHVLLIATLPFHHRDPFDRIITAQAQTENLTMISNDPQFAAYGVDLK